MFLDLLCKIGVCIRTERKFGYFAYGAKRPFALQRHISADGIIAPKAQIIPCDEVFLCRGKTLYR